MAISEKQGGTNEASALSECLPNPLSAYLLRRVQLGLDWTASNS